MTKLIPLLIGLLYIFLVWIEMGSYSAQASIERPPPLKEFIKNCPSPVMNDSCYIEMIMYIQRLHDCIDKYEGLHGG